jgi:phosphatidylethanolamine N-methyltransferase
MPLSSLPAITEAPDSNENQNPDDFRFWSEGQAKRIAEGIKQAFDVDCAPEVILADANVTLLTNLILAAREL